MVAGEKKPGCVVEATHPDPHCFFSYMLHSPISDVYCPGGT